MESSKSSRISPIHIKNFYSSMTSRDSLPPPLPLLCKTFKPCKPSVHIGNFSFIKTPDWSGKEPQIKKSAYHPGTEQIFPPNTTFSNIFPTSELIYIKDAKSLNPKFFNSNRYDLSHIYFDEKTNFINTSRNRTENSQVVKDSIIDSQSEPGSLKFESRFESGNLSMVRKIADNEYNLLLQNDVNTQGRVQWFFFRVTGCKMKQRVKFNIVNMIKSKSLFTQGMQISVYSCKQYESHKEGWHKAGSKISYYANGIERFNGKGYFTLSFTYEFLYENDSVYFAYAVPYTYTDLLKVLDEYEKDVRVSQILLRVPLCKTIGDNIVYLLTITSPGTREEFKKRKIVFLSARVHPGETVSSFIMEGVLQFLTGTSETAQVLREQFIFKIIPMLNPDGVINGNNRCSLTGVDLNRRWEKPSPTLHPEIFHYKKLITNSIKFHKIGLIADFHGHSIKHNIFIYGCNYPEAPHICKAFPLILSKHSNMFSYADCNFSMNPSKNRTLRIVIFKELGVDNTFTIESSFCGSDFGKFKNVQVTCKLLKRFGEEFCKTLIMLDDCLDAPRSVSELKARVEDDRKLGSKDLSVFGNFGWEEFVRDEQVLRSGENCCSGSDSEDSEDYMNESLMYKKIRKRKSPKKGKLSKSSKNLSPGKCKNCGKIEYADHVCLFLSKNRLTKQSKTPTFASPILESIRESKSPLRPKINISPSDPKLFTSPSQISIIKFRPEGHFTKSSTNTLKPQKTSEKNLPIESIRMSIGLETKKEAKEFSIIEKYSEFKAPKSISPIRGVHLLGIVEGIQCKLQKLKRNRGLMNRKNLNY